MLKWIENNATDETDMVTVAHILREHIVLRSKSCDTETKAPFKLSFELLWQSSKLQRIGIRSLLCDNKLRSFLPQDFQKCVDSVLICNKLTRPLGSLLFNYKHESKHLLSKAT